MKNAVLIFSLVSVFFLLSSSVYAEISDKTYPNTGGVNDYKEGVAKPVFRAFGDIASGSGLNTDKPKYSSDGGNLRDKNQDRQGDLKTRFDTKRKEMVEKYFQQMLSRFEAAIMRFDRLIGRIKERLAKMKASGMDTSSLDSELSAAESKLMQAKDDLNSLKTSGLVFTSSDNPKAAFSSVKQKVGSLRDELKSVYQMLIQIVRQLKGLHIGESATSSAKIKISITPIKIPTITIIASPSASF